MLSVETLVFPFFQPAVVVVCTGAVSSRSGALCLTPAKVAIPIFREPEVC